MSSNKWKGYDSKFLADFEVPMPKLNAKQSEDIAINKETNGRELPFIYYSAVQSKSRRMPFFTASNINRDSWLQAGREGTFALDDRLDRTEQLSPTIYSQLNKKHKEPNKKVDKGHLTKREDVQWDEKKNETNALEAAKATFFYTNACPQHHQLNNEIWKRLEEAVLVKGRSKKPMKAIVFSGPVFNNSDPNLVFPQGINHQIQCPVRFWKVIYYVGQDKKLHCAAFLMSHKLLMERDGHVQTKVVMRGLKMIEEKVEKPFLLFEENEKYQITLSKLQDLTGLQFTKAKEGLSEEQMFSKLSMKPTTDLRALESVKSPHLDKYSVQIEGLVL